MRVRSRFTLFGIALVLAVVAAGCSKPHATVELFHPFESGRQQSVQLESEWAHYDGAEGDSVGRLLCEWPLPGSRYGKKEYELYLRLPATGGVFEVGAPIDAFTTDTIAKDSIAAQLEAGPEVVSGFLIQRTGRLRGVTHVSAGRVELKGGKVCRGRLELICADQTEIVGDFVAKPGYDMTPFERKHQLDVANAKIVARGESLPDAAANKPSKEEQAKPPKH